MIGNEALELVEEYTYLGQMVSANPAHEKEIRRRIGMGWSAFGKQNLLMNSNLPLSLKRKAVYPTSTNVWVGNLASQQGVREETEKCTKGNGEKNAGCNMERQKRASWIREQTKVEDILVTIKNKKWTWAGHIMRRRDNRWTMRVTEGNPGMVGEIRANRVSGGGMKLEHSQDQAGVQ